VRISTDDAAGDALKTKIRELEQTRLRALVTSDMAVAGPLHAEDFQLIPPTGNPHSKVDYLGAIATGDLTYHVFEPATEIDVRLSGTTAMIRYRSRLEIVDHGVLRPLASYWHMDHYELRAGHWQIVWSQATAISSANADETP
jgi:hypothetical protein